MFSMIFLKNKNIKNQMKMNDLQTNLSKCTPDLNFTLLILNAKQIIYLPS